MLKLSILDIIYDLWPEHCIFRPAESERAKTFHAKTFRIGHVNQAIVKREKSAYNRSFNTNTNEMTHCRPFGYFSDHADTLKTIRTLFGSFGHLPHHLDAYQIIRTPIRSSGHLSDHPGTFYIIQRPFRSSGHLSDHTDTYQIIRALLISSRDLSDHPNTFHIDRIVKALFIS